MKNDMEVLGLRPEWAVVSIQGCVEGYHMGKHL